MGKIKDRSELLLTEESSTTPKRVQAASKIANRQERQERLSEILRDRAVTGAEAVAAARLLEGMERNDAAGADRGIPPPTNRPEQVARALRLMGAFGLGIMCDALDIYIARSEKNRAIKINNPEVLVNLERARAASARMRKWRNKPSEPGNRESQRPEHGASGTATAEPDGVPELSESAEPIGQAQDEDERNGDRDLQSGAEVGGES